MNMTLRMTESLYKELRAIALKEERSINGQINYIIKKYIEENSPMQTNDNKKND